jgi:hypothetical protein
VGDLPHLGAHVELQRIILDYRPVSSSTQACQLQTYGNCPDFSWLEERLLPLIFG